MCTVGAEEGASYPNVRRMRATNRMGCMARLVLRFVGACGFVFNHSFEWHNHEMRSDSVMQFLKVNKKIGACHKKFVTMCVIVNIGPAKSFRLHQDMVGGMGMLG